MTATPNTATTPTPTDGGTAEGGTARGRTGDDGTGCDSLTHDLGWGLAVVFRAYVKAADAATADIPGTHRGYQVLRAAAHDNPGSQAALAQRLNIDRTVMTYLLDDLESANLVARQPDPADRRSRRVVATPHGRTVLADLDTRFLHAEQHLLAGLAPDAQASFRALLRELAAHVNDLDPIPTACDAIADIAARLAPPPQRRGDSTNHCARRASGSPIA